MLQLGQYVFKRAETSNEFDQIHRLNFETFVHEIPQHEDNGLGQLVDKFHTKNVYLIVLRDRRVVGMVSSHDEPPFSIAERLPDQDILERPGNRPLEVRLLAIDPNERHSTMFAGLVYFTYMNARSAGYTHLLISGVADRVELYQRLGFVPLGPEVSSGNARFVPMALALNEELPVKLQRVIKLWETHLGKVKPTKKECEGERVESASALTMPSHPLNLALSALARGDAAETDLVCLLPGPVTTSPAVQKAFHQPTIYHRGPEFTRRFMAVRQLLSELVHCQRVAILNGSGTLGNEVVAATLAAEQREEWESERVRGWESERVESERVESESATAPRFHSPTLPRSHSSMRGIMLINGEFGERLSRQATRFGLQPRVLTWPWGQPWDLDRIDADLAEEPAGSWIWGVHQESSTGVLNDLPGLVRVARRRDCRVCVDCISSLGAVPLDLREVYLATGATGKSLGSYAGASLIFANGEALEKLDCRYVPSYLDLAAALASKGPCYTFPSPTLLALEAALQEYVTPERAQATFARYQELGTFVRKQLQRLGFPLLADDEHASPVITTFSPPGKETSVAFVARCRGWGYAIGGESTYLAQRRLVQIATMGAIAREQFEGLFDHLERWLAQRPAFAGTDCSA